MIEIKAHEQRRASTPFRTAAVRIAAALYIVAFSAVVFGTHAHARADDRVLAVLYFDNNTGNADYDVFQKGLADMIIVDLASVDGITVVERERLQALLDEISLQTSKYFDKRTAVKLGKGLGARYAVTGAIHELQPKMRLDIRMIDIATGKNVVATTVSGASSNIFELEQKLVKKFVKALNMRLPRKRKPQTKVPDVDTLLRYAQAVDMADSGNLDDAMASMQMVVNSAPSFTLARNRHLGIKQQLRAARARRAQIMKGLQADLLVKADRFVRTNDIAKLDQPGAKHYLAYRWILGEFFLGRLESTLHPSRSRPRLPTLGQEQRAQRLMEAYHANMVRYVRDYEIYAKRFTKSPHPSVPPTLDTWIRLPVDDQRAAKKAGLERDEPRAIGLVEEDLGSFLLLGRFSNNAGKPVYVAPPLAELDRAYKRLGYRHLQRAWARANRQVTNQGRNEYAAIRVLETHAQALFLRDQEREGIAKLQEILQLYPTSKRYAYIEKLIEQRIGNQHNHTMQMHREYAEGLKTCEEMAFRKSYDEILHHRMRTLGWAAIHKTVKEVEDACLSNKMTRNFWPWFYRAIGVQAGKKGDCALFESFVQRYLNAGGRPSGLNAYRKNLAKCPLP